MRLSVEKSARSSPVLFQFPIILYNNMSNLFINVFSAHKYHIFPGN